MTIRICRTEKFIPSSGNPVYQIQEELSVNGILQLLPPRIPTSEELDTAQDEFAAAQQAKIAALESDVARFESYLNAIKDDNEVLSAEIESLKLEKAKIESTVSEQVAHANKLKIEKEILDVSLVEANARIEQLLQQIPFNPRVIDATAFWDRLTKEEVLTLFTSADERIKSIGEVILEYKKNDWPIVFESTEFQQMLDYLLQSGVISEARVSMLTRDATRAEAYVADSQ